MTNFNFEDNQHPYSNLYDDEFDHPNIEELYFSSGV